MSDGGTFFIVLLGIVTLILFLTWLYAKWQLEHGETKRETAALAEFGPLFQMEPSAEHVTANRTPDRFAYVTDWDEVRKQAGR